MLTPDGMRRRPPATTVRVKRPHPDAFEPEVSLKTGVNAVMARAGQKRACWEQPSTIDIEGIPQFHIKQEPVEDFD